MNRSYEVSIWTLQDDFITVLKPSNLENKGSLQEPLMTLRDDGTEEFSFSIPMYIYNDMGERIENPIWYTVRDGIIIEGMRKIKVIFNKGYKEITKEIDNENKTIEIPTDRIFEFLITKTTENHIGDILTLQVQCEGLAFHELGKIGYKISLTPDTFYNDNNDYFEKGYWTDYTQNNNQNNQQPFPTLNYWNDKIFYNSDWTYEVQMDWSSYSGQRDLDKVYEDEYVEWNEDSENNEVVNIVSYTEKNRLINCEESNIYNLTQTIAETFGIFCRYEYVYDDNQHITGKKVIYYNNYSKEKEGYLDITYPYSTGEITREKDSTDLVTKLYVKSVEDSASSSGLITIMDVPANKSKEDYILNFDYLYKSGALSEELKEEVKSFNSDIRKINKSLIKYENKIIKYKKDLIELEAQAAIVEKSITEDEKQISSTNALKKNLISNGDNIIDEKKPDTAIIQIENKDGAKIYYINIKNPGVVTSTLRVYQDWSNLRENGKRFRGRIKKIKIERDDYKNLKRIILLEIPNTKLEGQEKSLKEKLQNEDICMLYLAYKYDPDTHYDNIAKIWNKKKTKDQNKLDKLKNGYFKKDPDTGEDVWIDGKIPLKKSQLENAQEIYDTKLEEKRRRIAKFENLMGPAIREGYWQPEDYRDYGREYNAHLDLYYWMKSKGETDGYASVIWDKELFEDEQDITYSYGVQEDKYVYPYIKLTNEQLALLVRSYDPNDQDYDANKNLGYIFWEKWYTINVNNEDEDGEAYYAINYQFGSDSILGFIKEKVNNVIVYKPVLVLIGVKDGDNYKCSDIDKKPVIGQLIRSADNIIENELVSYLDIDSENIIEGYKVDREHPAPTFVYPRIKINSLKFKNTVDELGVKFNENLLKRYDDYQVLSRDEAYYITLKPEALLKSKVIHLNDDNELELNGKIDIKYVISTADIGIYLDAIKVSQENASPKVSYTIKPTILNNENFMLTAYDALNRIVNINDNDLKFDDVKGYISELQLNLDKMWEDQITIKNYTTKFEDLFSTIVAQTEALKASGGNLGVLTTAFQQNGALTTAAIEPALLQSTTIFKQYLESNFDGLDIVQDRLREIFDEAGEVLSASQGALDQVYDVSMKNASILAGFTENVRESLTPTVYTVKHGEYPANPKIGDIMVEYQYDENNNIKTDENGKKLIAGTYVYTSYSAKDQESQEASHGWTRTHDGTLAAITGASLSVDAEAGKVEVLAENQIDLKSGGNVYIAANENVDIVGNKSVNIGGTEINIASLTNGNASWNGGINLVAASYSDSEADLEYVAAITRLFDVKEKDDSNNPKTENYKNYIIITEPDPENDNKQYFYLVGFKNYKVELNNNYKTNGIIDYEKIINYFMGPLGISSSVKIHPSKIEMTAADIEMQAGKGITMYASDNDNSAVVKINKDDGIWLGSNKGLTLYSGYANGSNANIELTPSRLLMGISNLTSEEGTAMLMTPNQIVLAVGNQLSRHKNAGSSDINEWQSGTFYRKDAQIKRAENVYKCNEQHTSGATFDSDKSKWTLQIDPLSINGTASGLIGARFTKGSIGFATSYKENGETKYNAILMNNKGVTVGSGNVNVTDSTSNLINGDKGSFVRIASDGVYIGSSADLYVNTNNFKLQTNQSNKGSNITDIGTTIIAIGKNLQNIDSNTKYNTATGKFGKQEGNTFTAYTDNKQPTVDLLLNKNGLYIAGTVYATAGSFTGSVTATSGKIGGWTITNDAIIYGDQLGMNDENDNTIHGSVSGMRVYNGADISNPNSIRSIAFWAGYDPTYSTNSTWNYNNIPFYVKHDGSLKATKATIEGNITANSGKIGEWTITNDAIIYGDKFREPTFINNTLNKRGSMSGLRGFTGTKGDGITPVAPSDSSVYTLAFWAGYNLSNNSDITFKLENIPFYVKHDGSLKATAGTIGGWNIGETQLTSNTTGSTQLKRKIRVVENATGLYTGKSVNKMCLVFSKNNVIYYKYESGDNWFVEVKANENEDKGIYYSVEPLYSPIEEEVEKDDPDHEGQKIKYKVKFIATNENKKLKIDNNYVEYDGVNSLDITKNTWYNTLYNGLSKTKLKLYVKFKMKDGYIYTDAPSNPTQINDSGFITLDAGNSEITASKATFGSFENGFVLNNDVLSGGTLLNTKLNNVNITSSDIESHSTSEFLRAFCDFQSTGSGFTLTRIDGTTVNFNVTATYIYQQGVAGAYSSGQTDGAGNKKADYIGKITLNSSDTGTNVLKTATVYFNDGTHQSGVNVTIDANDVYRQGLANAQPNLGTVTLTTPGNYTVRADEDPYNYDGFVQVNIAIPTPDSYIYPSRVQFVTNGVKRISDWYSGVYKGWKEIDIQVTSSGGCFVAGSLITLADETTIPIEQLQVGMEILAYDEIVEDFTSAEVLSVQMFKHKNNISELQLSNGKNILLTKSHPILTIFGWRAIDIEAAMLEHFIDMEQLQEGDRLITNLENEVYIEKIIDRNDLKDVSVYNCDIDIYDTYLIEDIVVHNADSKD